MFQIREVLGSGATATVCLASRVGDPDRLVALKVMRPDVVHDLEVLSRTRDEARMLRQLQHPDILHVYRLYDFDGTPVIEMERVDGVSLSALQRDFPQGMPGDIALTIGKRVAVALDAAYYSTDGPDGEPMHIVHRDIKPANILLARDGAVKVVDFGIAKASMRDRESYSYAGNTAIGTRGFRPPEPAMDASSADVYSLAVTLFVLMTGRQLVVSVQPERHDEGVDKALVHLRPEGLPDVVADRLRELLRAMLHYEPNDRPELCDVAGQFQVLAEHPELHCDLVAFAEAHVAPKVDARQHEAPDLDPAWPDIRFVDMAEPTPFDKIPKEKALTELREILTTDDWERRVGKVQRLLERADGDVTEPLLDVLERAEPGWRFWKKRARATEVAAVLQLLSGREELLKPFAAKLAGYPDERVALLADRLRS